jgi:hypothetical protein
MIELKTIENEIQLIASIDIPRSTKVLEASWFTQQNENLFFLPKTDIVINDVVPVEDLFIKVTLTGLAKFIKANQKGNTVPIINYETEKIEFISYRDIKKDELITYIFLPEGFPHVTIR